MVEVTDQTRYDTLPRGLRAGVMNLGIFGGSFDPIHNGHLRLAECCLQQAKLDEIWFTPAAQQPHKPAGPKAEETHRCGMIQQAILNHSAFRLSRLEVARGGVSFTVDTLRAIQADHPHDQLHFLMGADALRDFPNWHKPGEICQLARPIVAHRAGESASNLRLLKELLDQAGCVTEATQIDMPEVAISSSLIRNRIRAGDSIEGLAPEPVIAYIERHQLYRRPCS